MKVKSLFAATAITLASFSAGATVYNLGQLNEGATYLSGSLIDTVQVVKGPFQDTYNFSLGTASSLDASAGVMNFWTFKISEEQFTYSLVDSFDHVLGTGGGEDDGEAGFSVASLASGYYHLNVFGKAKGTGGGLYNGVLSISATTPIPEPESYAMLLAGLGLMGGIARRRANKKQA
jgi:hypothetical protein